MIDDADLLQVDATVIVGALIFLTIGTVSKGWTGKNIEEKITLVSTNVTILLLGISVSLLLFGSTNLLYSQVLTVIGVFVLLAPVAARIIVPVWSRSRAESGHGHVNDKK
jgi:hypothetical protein